MFSESLSHTKAISILLILIKSTRSCCECPFKTIQNKEATLEIMFTVTDILAIFIMSLRFLLDTWALQLAKRAMALWYKLFRLSFHSPL